MIRWLPAFRAPLILIAVAAFATLVSLAGCSDPPPPTPESLEVELSPSTTFVTEPLISTGWPSYLRAHNRREQGDIDREQNLGTILLQARYRVRPAEELLASVPGNWWGPADHPQLAMWVLSHELPLDDLHEHIDRPHFHLTWHHPENDPLIFAEPPADESVITVPPRALLLRSTLTAATESFEAAMADFHAAFRVAATTSQSLHPSIWGWAHDSHRLASKTAREMVPHNQNPQSLRAWHEQLRDAPRTQPYDEVMGWTQRIIALDLAVYFARRPDNVVATLDIVNVEPIPQRLAENPTDFDWTAILTQLNVLFDELEQSVAAPAHERDRAAGQQAIDQRIAALHDDEAGAEQQMIAAILSATGVTTATADLHEIATAELELTALLYALRAYHLENGRYPDTLSPLQGDFYDELPNDPFSDQPYHYRAEDDHQSFTLWSVGPNRRNDDGHPADDITIKAP